MQSDIIQAFAAEMVSAGLAINDEVIPDGQIHRFNVKGDKPLSKNGWYVLFVDGVPAGSFGSWKTGQSWNWCLKKFSALTPTEKTATRQRIISAKNKREAEDRKIKALARNRANEIWRKADPAQDCHPYLKAKAVHPYGIKQSKECLVIPLYDQNSIIHSLQFIHPDGSKRFLSGGRKKGCFYLIGVVQDCLAVCEGFATGASVFAATGMATAIAFDAGNLMSVSMALREKYPMLDMVICADNDTKTEGNPGLTKAKEAAIAINARLAIPPISGDFNDYCKEVMV